MNEREIVTVDGKITAWYWLDLAKAYAREGMLGSALASLRHALRARDERRARS